MIYNHYSAAEVQLLHLWLWHWMEWWASCPFYFSPRDKAPSSCWIRVSVAQRQPEHYGWMFIWPFLGWAKLFTSQSYNTSTELKTCTQTGFIWNSLYNLHTDHTENISASIVETCVSSHCIATVAALTRVNPLLLRYLVTTSKHSFFYCCVPLEVSMA
jgi:hypothetical protein